MRRESVERDQQMFSDLNRTARKTSKSLDVLYDHRDPMNRITFKAVASSVPIFKERTELESSSLSARSAKFVTLAVLYEANRSLLCH
jgi:DNA sulfur modification protein DndB